MQYNLMIDLTKEISTGAMDACCVYNYEAEGYWRWREGSQAACLSWLSRVCFTRHHWESMPLNTHYKRWPTNGIVTCIMVFDYGYMKVIKSFSSHLDWWNFDMYFSKDINECDSNPCQNGASCVNQQNAYACTCTGGWQGTDCNIGK